MPPQSAMRPNPAYTPSDPDHIGKVSIVDQDGNYISDSNPLPIAGGTGGGGAGDASAANQTTQITQLGSVTETSPATDTASSGINGRLQRIAQRFTSLIALLPASLGQKTKANSLAVTLASDQDALAVTLSGSATAANQATTNTQIGIVTETAPATDTASSGLNGRLQRIAQRLTSLIGLLPTALTTLGNLKVSIQEKIIRTYTGTAAAVAASGDQTLVAAPAAGNHLVVKDLVVQNESAVETTIILKSGSTAKWRSKLVANAALALSFSEGEEWRLGSAEALVLNLSGANSHGYSIRHRTEVD